MMRTYAKVLLSLLLAALLASGCDDTTDATSDGSVNPDGTVGDGTTPDGGPQPDAQAPPEGVVELKAAGTSHEVAFDTGNEEYLIVPYSVSEATASIDYTIEVTGFGGSSSSGLRIPEREPLWVTHPELWKRWQSKLAVARWQQQQGRLARASLRARPPKPLDSDLASCTLSSECEATQVCHEGACASEVSIKVPQPCGDPKTITTTVKKKGTSVAVLVDNAGTVSEGDLTTLFDNFDKTIYVRDVALFGNPKLEDSGTQLAADRNGDGLMWLVITPGLEVKISGTCPDSAQTAPADGFFSKLDFTEEANSNKADLLYITAPSSSGDVLGISTTIAHEFQHVLSWARVYKAAHNQTTDPGEQDLWLDEGLSHVAEDACGFGGTMYNTLVQKILNFGDDISMFATIDSPEMRLKAFLYLRHIFERKGGVSYNGDGTITDRGGAAWLQQVQDSLQRGTAAITATAGDYKAAFDNYVVAMSLDGRDVTDYAPYQYDPVISDPVTGMDIGVVIRGTRKDDADGQPEIAGPTETTIDAASTDDDMVNGMAEFFRLAGQSGDVTVNVTTDATDFRYAVIRLK